MTRVRVIVCVCGGGAAGWVCCAIVVESLNFYVMLTLPFASFCDSGGSAAALRLRPQMILMAKTVWLVRGRLLQRWPPTPRNWRVIGYALPRGR